MPVPRETTPPTKMVAMRSGSVVLNRTNEVIVEDLSLLSLEERLDEISQVVTTTDLFLEEKNEIIQLLSTVDLNRED